MANITRIEKVQSTTMKPMVSGDTLTYIEETIEGFAYRCDACGLVWNRKWLAEQCKDHGHNVSWEQGPYGVRGIHNGVPYGNIYYVTRAAMRRDAVQAR